MQPIHWQKSTYSGDGSNCVEVAATPVAVRIRDSKKTRGPHLIIHPLPWTLFISYTASSNCSPQSTGERSSLDN
ncbi:DUF397 domain-containing protein [Streptomyces canus]|uniref:DUF397 domain-containing protein n=1 Tax=Streptomyces canus TaxID=58343 RepID=UPI0030E43FCB